MTSHTTLTRPGADRSVLVQFAAAQMKAIQALVLGDDITCGERVELAAALRAAQRPTITWSEPEPGLHVLHAPGHVVRIYSDLIGLAAARAAMQRPGQPAAPASDFALPGAKYPDVAVRAALTRAAAFLADVCAPLSIAVDSIRVLDQYVVWNPSGAVDIVIENASGRSGLHAARHGEFAVTRDKDDARPTPRCVTHGAIDDE